MIYNNFICCKCINSNFDFSVKEYIPLISSAVVIILFIVDRIIGAKIRKKEIERNFYYKVLLEPNLETITLFFEEVEELYQNSSKKLSTLNEELFSDYLKTLRLEVELFKDKKRKFEFHLIYPIQKRYPNAGKDLLRSLNDIQDYYITQLDSMNFDNDNVIEFNMRLHLLKADFLSNLYKPLGK